MILLVIPSSTKSIYLNFYSTIRWQNGVLWSVNG
jgi:hypothetical protein